MTIILSVDVDEAQRRHAISANANFLIPDDDVPAVCPALEHGGELAAVVDVLARAHWPSPSLISYAEMQRSP
jgi:hypothetical protein